MGNRIVAHAVLREKRTRAAWQAPEL